MAIGDASLAFDPLSSQGILFALTSAQRAVDCILRWDEERNSRSYVSWTGKVLADYKRRRNWYYGLETRWPHSLFWQRRHREIVLPHQTALLSHRP